MARLSARQLPMDRQPSETVGVALLGALEEVGLLFFELLYAPLELANTIF